MKFVRVHFKCGHSKVYEKSQADKIIIGDYAFCFGCGRKIIVSRKQSLSSN